MQIKAFIVFAAAALVALSSATIDGQTARFDLLIRGGHVIDPKNGIDGVMDVAVVNGKVAEVSRGGAEADLSVLAVRRGTFGFVDVSGGTLQGDRKLECELTVKAGRVVWDLNGISHKPWKEVVPRGTSDARRRSQ